MGDRTASLNTALHDVDTWTRTVLARGELLRGLKEHGETQIVRSRFTARVAALGSQFRWSVTDGITGDTIASGVGHLAMTVCTSAALSLLQAESDAVSPQRQNKMRSRA